MNKKFLIKQAIKNSIDAKNKLLLDNNILYIIEKAAEEIELALRNNKKVLFCGNGGSAADAQHLAAELSGKFYLEREPLSAEALHTNTSALTAISNDYSFEQVFSRLVKAKGKEGDILVAISTSGTSPNIIKAIETANRLQMLTIGLTGQNNGKMKICKYLIKIPSTDVPRIQEAHILVGHIICEIVEKSIFGS